MTGHVNDHKLAALQSLLSISGGNIDDLEQAWLITEASVFGNPNDMWLQVFQDNGAASGNISDAAKQFLEGLGFSGDINQLWHDYWEAGGGIGATVFNVLDRSGASHNVPFGVLDRSGASHTITNVILDRNGNPFAVI